jgi:hypothetical protein
MIQASIVNQYVYGKAKGGFPVTELGENKADNTSYQVGGENKRLAIPVGIVYIHQTESVIPHHYESSCDNEPMKMIGDDVYDRLLHNVSKHSVAEHRKINVTQKTQKKEGKSATKSNRKKN